MKITSEQRDKMLEGFGDYLAARAGVNNLRESNRKKIEKQIWGNPENKEIRESMKRQYKIDVCDHEKFPVTEDGWSWKAFRESLARKAQEGKIREADTSSAFSQFLIAGILQNMAGAYMKAEVSYQDWVTVIPTKLAETPYAAIQGLAFPREVGSQSPYPVVGAGAYNGKLRARKFGSMYELEKELLEDDQTGMFKQQSGELGEYLQLLTEVLVYGKLASVANASYAGFDVGTSETKPSYEAVWPWTPPATPFVGGGFNRPASYGALTDANLKAGLRTLQQQKNLLGQVLPVKAKRVLISPYYEFDLAVLLNSAYYPAGAQAAGVTGGAFSINSLKGVADVTMSYFMPDNSGVFGNLSKAWYLVDDSKPWFQVHMRSPIALEQEAPNSGQSFDRDIIRFKANTRLNADVIDPRFAWRGSDGSV